MIVFAVYDGLPYTCFYCILVFTIYDLLLYAICYCIQQLFPLCPLCARVFNLRNLILRPLALCKLLPRVLSQGVGWEARLTARLFAVLRPPVRSLLCPPLRPSSLPIDDALPVPNDDCVCFRCPNRTTVSLHNVQCSSWGAVSPNTYD